MIYQRHFMTKALLLSIVSLVAITAQAAPSVIAKSVTAGGMPGPDPKMCMSQELSVYSDGAVKTTKCGKEEKLILTLSPDGTKQLARIANRSDKNGGKLEVNDPQAPECQDAPSTTISLVSPTGEVEIGGTVNCRKQSLRWDDRVYHFEATALRLMEALDDVAATSL
jgi:hypothetical protein